MDPFFYQKEDFTDWRTKTKQEWAHLNKKPGPCFFNRKCSFLRNWPLFLSKKSGPGRDHKLKERYSESQREET